MKDRTKCWVEGCETFPDIEAHVTDEGPRPGYLISYYTCTAHLSALKERFPDETHLPYDERDSNVIYSLGNNNWLSDDEIIAMIRKVGLNPDEVEERDHADREGWAVGKRGTILIPKDRNGTFHMKGLFGWFEIEFTICNDEVAVNFWVESEEEQSDCYYGDWHTTITEAWNEFANIATEGFRRVQEERRLANSCTKVNADGVRCMLWQNPHSGDCYFGEVRP